MTRMQGVLEQVETYQARTVATVDAASSDTVVFVARVEPLFTEAGSVTVDINGDTYTATPTSDPVAPYITLDPPLTGAVAADDLISVVPSAEVKWATVSFPSTDDDGTMLQFRVPLNLAADTALADGPKDGDERVAVWVETEPEPFVVDLPNRRPEFDGGFIAPDSIPPTAITDGDPPASSPQPTLAPFAVGGLRWSVTPVANTDPVRFRVYADTVDPPTIDAAHLVADTGSISGTFDRIDNVRLLPDDPNTTPDLIYVACIEYDADGDADVSATSDPAVPNRADNSYLSADVGFFGSVEANQIQTGRIESAVIGIGDYLDLDGPNSSFTIWSDIDHTVAGTQLRSDGSVFRGDAEVDNLAVSGQMVVRGEAHLTTNGGLILDSGVGDPMVAPTLTASPEPSTFPAVPPGYSARGFCWDGAHGGGQWLRLIRRIADGLVRVETINSAGTSVTATTSLSDKPADANSITVIGPSWYVMMRAAYGTGVQHWRARKYDTSGTPTQIQNGSIPIFGDRPCAGTDGTNLLVAAQSGSAVSVAFWSASNIDTLVGNGTWPGTFADSNLMFVGGGSFDFGASRVVICAGANVHSFSLSGSTLTEQSSEAFGLPTSAIGGGFTWDGTDFFSTHGAAVLFRYNDTYPGVGDTAYVAYRDADTGSGDHTKASPVAAVPLVARWGVQAALPPAPAGAEDPEVFMGVDTTPPAVTSLLARSETVTARNTLIDPSVAGGSALGTDTNTFGTGGTPGYIASSSGGFEAHGDGTVLVDSTLVVGETWTAPTLTGSWANFGSGYFNAGHRNTPNHVHLRGTVKSGGTGTGNPIFTLPAGSRPTATVRQIVASSNGIAFLEVDTSGRVYVIAYGASGSNASVCLDTIYFALD